MKPADRLPTGYGDFLADLKGRIRAAQVRAALAVNSELVLLYWQIGRGILDRQAREGWGAKVIDRLSSDLRQEFPEMKGFSPRTFGTCGRSPKPGRMRQLCDNQLHNCLGPITSSC